MNRTLASAGTDRIRIAHDVIARGVIGGKLAELQLLEELKLRVSEGERLRKWAREVEAHLTKEKQVSAKFRAWAGQAQAALDEERTLTTKLRGWAEDSQAKLDAERRLAKEMRAWAEGAQAKLDEERKLTRQLREWAENAEARAAAAKAAATAKPAESA